MKYGPGWTEKPKELWNIQTWNYKMETKEMWMQIMLAICAQYRLREYQ